MKVSPENLAGTRGHRYLPSRFFEVARLVLPEWQIRLLALEVCECKERRVESKYGLSALFCFPHELC